MNKKERIKELMNKNDIDNDKILLIEIIKNIGLEGRLEDNVERCKGNFSKMLSGERRFPYEYILAMEEVLKTSILYIEKGINVEVPKSFRKGFEYVAFTNKYEEFEKLSKETSVDGRSIIDNVNEYGQTLMDCIIKYDTIEGIRFFYDKYQLKYDPLRELFKIIDPQTKSENYLFSCSGNKVYLIAKMLIESRELELYQNIFDYYALLFYYNDHCQYFQDNFLKLILDSKDILNTVLNCKKYPIKNNCENKKVITNDTEFIFVNPLINAIFKYALDNYDKYQEKVDMILKKGLVLNKEVIEDLLTNCNEIKNTRIYEDGFIRSSLTHILYTYVFYPQENNKQLSSQTKRLIKDNIDLLENKLHNKDDKVTNIDSVMENIYNYSGIRDLYRNNNKVLEYIKSILIKSDFDKNNVILSSKLMEFLNKKITTIDKNDDYNNIYQEIKWSMIFVELYKNELDELIK